MLDQSPDKILKDNTIYSRSEENPIPVSRAIPKDKNLLPTDRLYISFVPAYYSENNSNDAYFDVTIERTELETDAEFKKRQEEIKINKYFEEKRHIELQWHEKERLKKLKKEFEDKIDPELTSTVLTRLIEVSTIASYVINTADPELSHITFDQLPNDMFDTDYFQIVESPNWDITERYIIKLCRNIPETDHAYNLRMEDEKKKLIERKPARYEEYLKLLEKERIEKSLK